MTNAQAIIKLNALYGDVQLLKPNLYGVKGNGTRAMYRLEDGILYKKIDIDMHTCGWEEVE